MVKGAPSSAWEFDDVELRLLAGYAQERAYPKNAMILNEGDAANAIYIIRSGRVKVFLPGEDGKAVLLNIHGPGEYFGEMGLDAGPRSASVMTLEPSQFLIISNTDFRNFVAAHADFATRLIHRLMQRIRTLTQRVKGLALLDVYGRVARLLLELAVEQDGSLVIARKLTQKDIAERVGASREMVSRILKDLSAGGYIEIKAKRIVITRDLPDRW